MSKRNTLDYVSYKCCKAWEHCTKEHPFWAQNRGQNPFCFVQLVVESGEFIAPICHPTTVAKNDVHLSDTDTKPTNHNAQRHPFISRMFQTTFQNTLFTQLSIVIISEKHHFYLICLHKIVDFDEKINSHLAYRHALAAVFTLDIRF